VQQRKVLRATGRNVAEVQQWVVTMVEEMTMVVESFPQMHTLQRASERVRAVSVRSMGLCQPAVMQMMKGEDKEEGKMGMMGMGEELGQEEIGWV